MQCSGAQPQLCDASGAWQSHGQKCHGKQTCDNGACVATGSE
jgi:hypothetical protein